MFDIGFAELILLSVIGMVVIGPERLPGVVRTVGKTMGKARRFLTGLQNQIEQEIKLDELNKKIMTETKDMDFTQPIIQPKDHGRVYDDDEQDPLKDHDHDTDHDLHDVPSIAPAEILAKSDVPGSVGSSSGNPTSDKATDVNDSSKS